VLNHTRCPTLPGPIATTSADPANACCNSPEPVILTLLNANDANTLALQVRSYQLDPTASVAGRVP